MAREQKVRKRYFWIIGLVAGIVFLVILVGYIAAAVYFSSHFYAGTTIFGVDCSLSTAEEAKEMISEQLSTYVLQIQERDGKAEEITAADIDLVFMDDNTIDEMVKEQRSYLWPLMSMNDHSSLTTIAFAYSPGRAEEALRSLDCMNEDLVVKPENAYILATEDGFVIVSEVTGNELDFDKTLAVVTKALEAGDTTVSLEKEDCYLAPTVYADDKLLNANVKELNELTQAYIIYNFGDREEIISPTVMQDWVKLTMDGNYVIDEMAVADYVSDLADAYDTYGKTRQFETAYGTTVTVENVNYGWEIEQNDTLIQLLSAVQEGYHGELDPVYTHTAMSRDTNDLGGTYVEICISEQEMFCYEDGECIVDTPIVTGNPNNDNGTPSNGVWQIYSKQRSVTLVGEDYNAPVDYWLPFNGNVGIHDLKSRSSFGGDIYLYNGSHGCINTPYDAVVTIFDTVSVGTAVVVYD